MFVSPSLWKSFCVFCVRVSFIKVKQHLSSLLRPAPLAASAVTSSFTSCTCPSRTFIPRIFLSCTFTSRYITFAHPGSYHHLLFISPFCFPHISTSSRLFTPPPFVSLSLSPSPSLSLSLPPSLPSTNHMPVILVCLYLAPLRYSSASSPLNVLLLHLLFHYLLTSSHLHIVTAAHLHILHLHIFSSYIVYSCMLRLQSSLLPSSSLTSSHLLFLPLLIFHSLFLRCLHKTFACI